MPDLTKPGLCQDNHMLLTTFVCSDAFVYVGEAPLRSGGATGAFAITAPASTSSASPDKERNNDMPLTQAEWKNPYSVATFFVCASSRVCFLCLTKKARSDLAADTPTPQPAL